jgi:hypothetical protein
MTQIDRKFYMHNPETEAQTNAAYQAKAERNKANGLNLISSGQLKPFVAYSEQRLKTELNVNLNFDDESRAEIAARVIDPLAALAQKYGISAIYSGKGDLASHTTLQQSLFKNMPAEQEKARREFLDSDRSHFQWIAQILHGLQFTFDDLVIPGSMMYISTSSFRPDNYAFYKARRALLKRLNWDQGGIQNVQAVTFGNESHPDGPTLEPIDYSDITHSTVARITGYNTTDGLISFANAAYNTVGIGLKEKSLTVKVGDVFIGRSYDYFLPQVDPQYIGK